MPKIIQLPLGPLQTNCYLFICEETQQTAVIDPAWDGKAIADLVAKEGGKVTHILLTHAHFDHVGGLAELKELTNAPIYIHADALPMLGRTKEIAKQWGLTVKQPPPHDNLLNEGDEIMVGQHTIQVLFTPGHAPGHVCFYLPDLSLIFDGDVLFQQSIGRTDLPGGDYDLLMDSIAKKLMVLPDETQVLSGHGAATQIGIERQHNPFLQ